MLLKGVILLSVVCLCLLFVGNGAATSKMPFVEWWTCLLVMECWREHARRLMWQKSLVCRRVWFPGHGSDTTHLEQPWDDMQVADNEQQLIEKSVLLLFRPVDISSALLYPFALTSWTPLEPMSASRLSVTDCMMSVFAPENPTFVFHSLRNTDTTIGLG